MGGALKRLSLLLSLTFFSLQLAILPAVSQWRPLPGPAGASVTSMVALNNRVLAATPGCMYFSTDSGKTWEPSRRNPRIAYVNSMVAAGGRLIATDISDIAVSSDSGVTWTMQTTITRWGFNCLAADGATVYLGTGAGVYRTTDGGDSWTAANGSLRATPVRALAASPGVVYAGFEALGVCVSTNRGLTWQRKGVEFRDRAMTHLAANSGSLCASDDPGSVFVSSDSGETWSKVLQVLNIRTITGIGKSFFVVSSTAGILRSSDRGQRWTTASQGLPNGPDCVASIGSTLFTGLDLFGVYRSTDNGALWSESTQGIMDRQIFGVSIRNSSICVGTLRGLFKSSNGGTSWRNVYTGVWGIAFDCLTVIDPFIYASSVFRGVLRSSDDGDTWLQMGYGLRLGAANCILQADTCLLAGTAEGIFRRSNNGEFWERVDTSATSVSASLYVYDMTKTSKGIFAGTYTGIYVSRDGGTTWDRKDLGPSVNPVYQIRAVGDKVLASYSGVSTHQAIKVKPGFRRIEDSWTNLSDQSLKWVDTLSPAAMTEQYQFLQMPAQPGPAGAKDFPVAPSPHLPLMVLGFMRRLTPRACGAGH